MVESCGRRRVKAGIGIFARISTVLREVDEIHMGNPVKGDYKLVTIADYEPLIGVEAVERICRKAERLNDVHVVHVNSTYYHGGAAEILSSTLLMNAAGIKTGWRAIRKAS